MSAAIKLSQRRKRLLTRLDNGLQVISMIASGAWYHLDCSCCTDMRSTRPFLTMVEKRWIAFQLLNALRDTRNRKVSHGDIKSENILVTSWNWIYLADFASYKPTYLPLDDPADFSFFFDTSGRRTCYIAPERFYTATDNPEISSKKSKMAMGELEGKRDGKVTEAMDCFSAGCVIAELFLEGAPPFTLSQLFKYREGEYEVDTYLTQIEDEGVRVSRTYKSIKSTQIIESSVDPYQTDDFSRSQRAAQL